MHTPFTYQAELQYRRDQVRSEIAAARRRPRVRLRQGPDGTLPSEVGTRPSG